MFSVLSLIFMCGYTGTALPAPLSAQQEQRLIERMSQGDTQARDKLIECNLRLVAHIVKKYSHSQDELDEYISVGTIGLIKAVTSFDPKRSKLATYAGRCIENEILMTLRSDRKHRNDVSLQSSVGTDKEGNEITLEERLADPSADTQERLETQCECLLLLRLIYTELTARERYIICHRYGIGTDRAATQREIAARLKISRSYVSRIEKRAMGRLRNRLNELSNT
jgi:RNA polymerase sporulation-specific sigma factor